MGGFDAYSMSKMYAGDNQSINCIIGRIYTLVEIKSNCHCDCAGKQTDKLYGPSIFDVHCMSVRTNVHSYIHIVYYASKYRDITEAACGTTIIMKEHKKMIMIKKIPKNV